VGRVLPGAVIVRRALTGLVVAAVVAVAGCGGGGGSPAVGGSGSGSDPGSGAGSAAVGSPASSGPGSTAPSPSGSGGGIVASLAPGTFANPVIADDFPDPFVLEADGRYYAYATTDGAQHLQLARSDDLVTWEELDDPLPKIAIWSSGDTWAPEVMKTSAGYVLYYTAHDPELKRPDANGSQCITVAVSDSPEGPFVDSTTKPLVCQGDLGGSIDATPFTDTDGERYLIWKNDGNCCGIRTRFFLQPLSADGLKLTGKDADLGVVNDEPWEGALIEAPTLIERDGTYYLFYSANGYDTDLYAVGYATSKKLTGPYTDAPDNPILASAWGRPITSQARGPGHQSIVEGPHGGLWIVFHAWDDDAVGYGNLGMRSVWLAPLTLADGKASVDGPSDGPLPDP
jgi:beta-xylosidase